MVSPRGIIKRKARNLGVIRSRRTVCIEGIGRELAAEGQADLPDARQSGGSVDGVEAHALLRVRGGTGRALRIGGANMKIGSA